MSSGRRPPGKPPPVEFLPEEFVLEDVESLEELPGELLIEEESNVIFAGPSDVPPRPDTAAPPTATRSRAGAEPSRRRWVRTAAFSVAACLALLLATARWGGSAQHRPPTAGAAFASPSSTSGVSQAAASLSSTPDDPSAEAGASVAATEKSSEAVEKKSASQQALEHGKVALSIELGERAVELDPTDGDSWLILGAAYMQRGDNKNARRCFSSCVNQATSGELKECRAMLR